jgi:ribulose 1,5-bisphosphate synthetase/thiazole synthase
MNKIVLVLAAAVFASTIFTSTVQAQAQVYCKGPFGDVVIRNGSCQPGEEMIGVKDD